jgi:ADP-ribose pyrophosphatase
VTDDHLIERVVERRVLHEGPYMTFRVDTVVDDDGRNHQRMIVDHPGAVVILPLAGDEILLVRQFRTAIGEVLLELPAGTLDRRGDGSVERPEEAAPRELGEETGHRARDWRKLGSFFSAPGFTSEELHLFLARDLVPIEGYAGPDVDERLDMVRRPWREAVLLARTGGIRDAKSLVGLFWLEALVERGGLDP